MSVTIHDIRWKASYLQVEYSSDTDDRLYLYRVKSKRFVPFQTIPMAEGRYLAQVNLVLGGGREVLPKGEWILCTKIDDDLLVDLDTLLAAKPHLIARIEHDARRKLPAALRD